MQAKILFILLVITNPLYSQSFSREFGVISQDEINMKSYNKDADAGAVILFDIGKSEFFDTDDGYDIRFTRHKRIKIFENSALDHAEISIPFYVDSHGKSEVIRSIEAVTYNEENGRLVKQELDASTINEEIKNEWWRNKKFVFPHVKEGSILELKYILETPFHFNLPDWTFQDKIPTAYSEYQVRMVPFYEYVFLAQGISRFDYQKSELAKEKRSWGSVSKVYGQNVGSGVEFHDYVHSYALKDVPAFKDESYISSINDYIIKLDFQLSKFHSPSGGSNNIISTWPELNKALLKHEKFGKYQKSCDRFAKKVLKEDIDISGKTEKEKSEIIAQYVKNNFKWNGYYSKYASQSAKDFFNKKAGNSADINLFLAALLNSAGIDAQPVVLSTRNHRKIVSDYPFNHFLNYIIVLVNGETPFLCDGTENLLPYNRIPPRCINEKGLIVNSDDEKWLKLEHNIPSFEKKLINISINPESLNANVNVSIQAIEYDAYYYRLNYKNDTTSLKAFFSGKIGEINRMRTLFYDETSKPYSINFEGKTEMEKLGDNLIINPFLNLSISKNKLTQKERKYPVDFVYPNIEEFEITVNIPDGFKLAGLPERYVMDNDLAEINITYYVTESNIKIQAKYAFKKPIYVANEYARIKSYLNTVVKKFNEEIVFEKI